MKTYNEALNQAKSLPTHVNGQLQPHYVFFNENESFKTCYSDNCNPTDIFDCLNYRANGAERYYIKTVQTYREDGSLKSKKEWANKLFFHKKWARTDIEVISVEFNIVGIKRQTTHLPAGILISNVKFIH